MTKLRFAYTLLYICVAVACLSARDMARIQQGASRGNAQDMRELGVSYLYGAGVPVNYEQAWTLLNKALKKGDATAEFFIAQMYNHGWYVDEDITTYMVHLRSAASKGVVPALTELGTYNLYGSRRALVPKNEVGGVAMLRGAAEKGDPNAMLHLGYAYADGLGGLQQSPTQAYDYFSRAASAGVAQGNVELGKCYLRGFGVEQDNDVAYRYLSTAYEAGSAEAAYVLGNMYRDGTIGSADPSNAVELYRKAAEDGVPEARAALGWMYFRGSGVERNARTAYKCFQRAVAEGCHEAYGGIGLCHEYGIGTYTDIDKAMEYYAKGASSGDDYSCYRLYMVYRHGNDKVPADTHRAMQYLQQALESDYDYAFLAMGEEYLLGEIVDKDTSRGLALITKAADACNPVACAKLGNMYYKGEAPVSRDFDKAFGYLSTAAQFADDLDREELSLVYRNLSACYRFGRGTTQNLEMANQYTALATRLGDSDMEAVYQSLK